MNEEPLQNGGVGVIPIRRTALTNCCFRREIWTGPHAQITVMCIPSGGEIGLEIHNDLDQILVIEYGVGSVYAGKDKKEVAYLGEADASSAVVIPAGTYHNVINRRNTPLKLFSIYAPPKHPIGTIHQTKFDSDLQED